MSELYKALAGFQQEVPNIYKNAKGYSYKFADLGEINDVIKPLLKKHGLGYIQPIDGSTIKTIVFHVESGESIESAADIPQGVQLKGMNDFQVLGSAITYLRRYSLSSMLGLITDEDADAAGTQVNTKTDKIPDLPPKERELSRAKTYLNKKMQDAGYDTVKAKQLFVHSVLLKDTIDTNEEADEVLDALNNESNDSTESTDSSAE